MRRHCWTDITDVMLVILCWVSLQVLAPGFLTSDGKLAMETEPRSKGFLVLWLMMLRGIFTAAVSSFFSGVWVIFLARAEICGEE